MSAVVAISDRRLVQDIEAEHQAAVQSFQVGLGHAARCGELLLTAQAECQTSWSEWVETNLSFGERQAQKYMRFAREARVRPELVSSHSTLNNALDAIADRRKVHPLGPGSTEFFTPPQFIQAARATLDEIDLDPASCEQAQQQVQARTYLTKDDDGLAHQWSGTVWINPPYREVGKFVDKLLEEIGEGRVNSAILLVNAYSECKWFQRAAAACSAICFPLARLNFLRPGEGDLTKSAYGSALFYFGANVDGFRRDFEKFGVVVAPLRSAP